MLLKDVRERQERIRIQLASNSLKNIEEYRHLTGQIYGLEASVVLVQELFDKTVSDRSLVREQ